MIQSTRGALIRWNNDVFGSIRTNIRRLFDQLEHLQGSNFSPQRWEAERRVQSEFSEALKREECI